MSVKRIQRTGRDRVAEVLAAAFHDYPVMRYVLADAGPACLGVIGVHPQHQDRGLATLLLREVARLTDEHPFSTGVCLNTESLENVPLYEHTGYRILGERDVGPLHTWCMFRAQHKT